MAKKTRANKFLVVIMALVLFSMILATLATLAHADTPAMPALTKQAVFTIGSNVVTVDGQTYSMDVAPYIDSSGRTMVPVRYLGDVLGMTAGWDQAKQQVTLTEQHFTAVETLAVGSNKLGWINETVDGNSTMDTTPVIVPPGRTMLPARWVAQAIGYQVTWNAANQTVTVTPPGTAPAQTGGSGGSVIPGGGPAGNNAGGATGTAPGPDSHNF